MPIGIVLLVAPGNNTTQTTQISEDQRFVQRAGEVYGDVQQRNEQGEWITVKSNVMLAQRGNQRAALSPEEMQQLSKPLINVPPTPGPGASSPPPQIPSDRSSDLPGYQIPDIPLPTIETYPQREPLSIDDLTYTRDPDVQRRFIGLVVGEGFRLDSGFVPEWYDAHHIIPLNEYPDLQGLRDKFAAWYIDLNSLDNGVALPNGRGQGVGTLHSDTQSNFEYQNELNKRFDGVTTREQALERLAEVKQELRDGTFIGPKKGKP